MAKRKKSKKSAKSRCKARGGTWRAGHKKKGNKKRSPGKCTR